MSARRFPEDPSFPQLEVAGDPEQMREIFQRHLRPSGEKTYRIRECQISQTRYRQASRCMLQYDLYLEEADTGHERSQIVTGLMHAGGRTQQIWRKLQRSNLGRGGYDAFLTSAPFRWLWEKLHRSSPKRTVLDASAAFEPYAYVPELEMLVQVFPYDYQLPALPLLMTGSPPDLESLLLDRFGPGEWQAEAWEVEPIRYQAETRATLRLTLRARDETIGRAEQRRFYAKVYRQEEKGEHTYRVAKALWEQVEAGGEGFTVGRPVVYLRALRTLIQEEVSGNSFREILLRGDEVIPAARKVARALATLHLDVMPSLQHHSRHTEVVNLESRSRLLQQAFPHWKSEIENIFSAMLTSLEKEVPATPTHNDLGLGHILIDDDQLALVDLDAFARADPLLDVANVLSQFAVLPLVRSCLPRERAREAARAFAEEYFAHVPEHWRERLPLQYASALLKRASGLYKNQTPGWYDKAEALVEEAHGSLIGKVW